MHELHACSEEHLLRSLDPAAQGVFVRPKARGSPELRWEMHSWEASRRSEVGKAHGHIEAGLNIFDGSLEPPMRKFAPPQSLGGGHTARRGQEPCDDGHADAVRVSLSERAANAVGFKQGATERIKHYVCAWNGLRAEYRYLVTGHVAGTFVDQSVRYVQVQHIV